MKEMQKLKAMLEDANIPFEVTEDLDLGDYFGKNQKIVDHIYYPNQNTFWEQYESNNVENCCSVVCKYGTYGYDEGLLEMLGLDTFEEYVDVRGWLTADNVFNRIKQNYFKERED